jgi:voltage-gated potassium channel
MSKPPKQSHRLVHVSLDQELLEPGPRQWQLHLYETIFGFETLAGRLFDIGLLIAILLSVVVVMLDSVMEIRRDYGTVLFSIEWGLTILFSIEYVLRLACLKNPARYAVSFLGIVDLLAILPSFLSLFLTDARFFSTIRAIRFLRIFRILKLVHYLEEFAYLSAALRATRRKIMVFVLIVMTVVVIMGSLLYVVEGPEHGFSSIPESVYWAIVTMTTVGYGDITPQTFLGKVIASLAMIIGYCMIIVPTGVFTVEVVTGQRERQEHLSQIGSGKSCPVCQHELHEQDAKFCKLCGNLLEKTIVE